MRAARTGLAAWVAWWALVLAGVALAARGEAAGEDLWWRSAPVADGGEVGILRSPADDRGYRYLRLDNGLQVVLIADPAADKAAAALSVAVGSFDNPEDRPGLAHFLEHMLFLGTEKYPEPGAYQEFISAHGGSHNAYTSLDRTTFFFEVDAAYLESALDRFAQFFIAPRFDAEYVAREREAVDAEYRLKLKDDARRQGDVLAEVINPAHPLAKFSVGNRETLADLEGRPVRDELLDFYRRHYSADRMALAVSGKAGLDELEAMVRARFAAVERRPPPAPPGIVPLLAKPGPLLVQLAPDRERRELALVFELPPQAPQWAVKPAIFLSHLLGDESEHSLLAELKERGWAERLEAGLAYDTGRGAALALSIGLTPAGVSEHAAVLDLTWQWFQTVRQRGLEAWRYRELAQMRQADFRFQPKAPPVDQVLQVAESLHDYPPAEVLRGPYVLQGFDAQPLAAVADRLRPDQALIAVTAPEFTGLARRSRHYQVPYQTRAVPGAQVAAWRDPAGAQHSPLRLPGPNPYLPERFPVSARGGPDSAPTLLADGEALQLWHYQDQRFGTPRSVFSAQLLVPAVRGERGAALAELYLALVREQLEAALYPAELAGLAFDLQRWDGGLEIHLDGYADKQELLLDRVLAALAAPRWDAGRFARVKASLIREWRNTRREWPVRLAMMELAPLLNGRPRPLAMAAALEAVDGEALRRFCAELYRRASVRVYTGGVLDGDQARRLAGMIAKRLEIGAPAPGFLHEVTRLQAAERTPSRGVAAEQADQAVLLYLQGGDDSLAERARVAVLQKSIEAPFYTRLRTELQLGYVVGSQIMPFNRVPGMILYVQSPRVAAAGLSEEIDAFLAGRCAAIGALQPAELERLKRAVLAGIEEQPKNLAEQADRHRESLGLRYRAFDFRPRLAAAVKAVGREDLADACRRLFGARRRGLWVVAADADTVAALRRDASPYAEGTYAYPW
ncbi:MAG: insulinase family protein [Pseudomonadota bacterium]